MAAELKDHFIKEIQSFKSPPPREVAPIPKVGEPAPEHEKLKLPHDKPAVIVFLRHCGCPFAEKSFRNLVAFSNTHAGKISCIAISHSSQEATEKWIPEVGGEWETEVIVDEDRDLYAAWGLGLSSYWHAVGPMSIYNAVQLGKNEGIWNKTVDSGTRWQTGGAFAVDRGGKVRWASIAKTASDIPDLDAALRAFMEVPTETP
ncbi:hypothetical protein M406DRAFT_325696 [Cryphonectria parasitica EP155]|uniref:Thioredoxin domain-containing protein n=1 Tax=Cryphonectria parasitica (strain ATCC 38755 / EP155) TaxID=660469 RepID=A0A9P4YBY9_CRYP1|nr:uncharacterized protein M406DRAFT_325696 [Cryphonectria parasitica EP155]KAF3770245.1 hypothetical protein M406DRAFT_325696 [Cryphonectria parasitica EP155]